MDGVVEQKQSGITFYISPRKLIFITELQAFILVPRSQYTAKPHAALRKLIECGEVKNLSDLCSAMEGHTVMVGYRKEWI